MTATSSFSQPSKLPDPRQVERGRAPRPFFTRLAQEVSRYAGKPATFVCAVAIILIWGATGPLFGYNDTWQLIINTSTTIVTFLMVFLIQNSQNRDTAALQIKLDELIARTEGPRNALLDLEDLDETTLEKLRMEYALLADRAREEGKGQGGARDPGAVASETAPVKTAEKGAAGCAPDAASSPGPCDGGRQVAAADCPDLPGRAA
ncbi:low affinity iron permease family protein [Roseixanthobacter glucoisosaccharinicivorans]|uniref:low affinity iron permease family protein n=1 Tax=Roseixanthobacter glucoisosaccharinicivorans TaxID=3119923 RepID=UPI0037277ECB